MKIANYARYSSDLSQAISIEDQIRLCTRFVDEKGWTVDERQIRSDKEKSGATLRNRVGLQQEEK